MDYKTKNMIHAFATFIGLTVGFWFFFGMRLFIPALLIGLFLSVCMFYTPSKIQKLKKLEDAKANKALEHKEISEIDLDNLNLDEINLDEETDN